MAKYLFQAQYKTEGLKGLLRKEVYPVAHIW